MGGPGELNIWVGFEWRYRAQGDGKFQLSSKGKEPTESCS